MTIPHPTGSEEYAAQLRAQLVKYFCDWNHLPTAENLSIAKTEGAAP